VGLFFTKLNPHGENPKQQEKTKKKKKMEEWFSKKTRGVSSIIEKNSMGLFFSTKVCRLEIL
jgi:hypothetical protein